MITAFAVVLLAACDSEDPGPLQDMSKSYSVLDFDRLEMGSGFNIRVEQSNNFEVRVEGDRRNINDLEVFKSGSTLVIRYDENEDRNHQTYITIKMPVLRGFNFSGGSVSVVSDFESDEELDLVLSGGSVCQLDAGYREVNAVVSGGSVLKLHGLGDEITADISGASTLSGFDFPVREANLTLSGASVSRVTVSDDLYVNASGASRISYRGSPSLHTNLSGGSVIEGD
jgi:hypothetical protein